MGLTKYYSPLRYPGGKGKIADYIKLILEENLLLDGCYIEPYAGGASVAIDLLINEYVSEIHINDIDSSVYSFWNAILNYTDSFCEKIIHTELTINEWHKQRDVYRNPSEYSQLDVGFSAFYLNRTNISGILTGGIIGGIKQTGKWKMDARFTKDNLITRIQNISDYKGRIYLYNEDAVKLISKLSKITIPKTLYYLDPPYYKKGKDLYVNYYTHSDHVEIAKTISELENVYWLISYDDINEIRDLYKEFRQQRYGLHYSAAESKKGQEVLIFSDSLVVPDVLDPISKMEIRGYYSHKPGME
ncbi:MAG: DNA adenine methylase [Candidatus Thiosymbion ectosymbiont of Robbea hypermnestra]|nr:DNA adenine methylase [Candidatus Thiosymbion ectosymbiont of Robbea hypermnestra]